MRKKKILITIAVLLATFATPLKSAYATGGNKIGFCRNFLGLTSWDCNIDDINNIRGTDALSINFWKIVVNVLNNITVIAAYLILGYIIYGGYQYILSGGSADKVANGKKTIIHGFTGLAIVLLANIIMNTIRFVLLGPETDLINCVTTECVNPTKMLTGSIQWAIAIVGLISLVFIVYGGISFMTSAGDSNKVKKAKSIIVYSVVGLIIVALAEIIIAFVTNLINSAS